jgi:hypothetical protein
MTEQNPKVKTKIQAAGWRLNVLALSALGGLRLAVGFGLGLFAAGLELLVKDLVGGQRA